AEAVCSFFRTFCCESLTGWKSMLLRDTFWLISLPLGPKVRARTLMLETIHPAQVLPTRQQGQPYPGWPFCFRRHALGSRRTKVGKLSGVRGRFYGHSTHCFVCFAIWSPKHVDQSRRLFRARNFSKNEGICRPA